MEDNKIRGKKKEVKAAVENKIKREREILQFGVIGELKVVVVTCFT